jgi:hypothetical protein
MIWVVDARYMDGYRAYVKFNDGKESIIDFKDYIQSKSDGTIFEALKKLENFQTLLFNPDIDTIEWANGADIAPERLYELANKI